MKGHRCQDIQWVWEQAAQFRSTHTVEMKPLTVGCPWRVNPSVNRLSPANKASIHGRHSLLLLAQGPVGVVREATVSATVSEMDEGGNTQGRRVFFRPIDILDCVWHISTKSHIPLTSLAPAQWTYGVPKLLNTYAKEIRLPLMMMTKLYLSRSRMGIESALHTGGGEQTCIHTGIHAHVCNTKAGILHKGVRGWWHTVPQTSSMMDMIDQSPSLFNQGISHQMDGMGGGVRCQKRGQEKARGSL